MSLTVDTALIRRYDRSGPRYTSYPTALQFSTSVGSEHYRQLAVNSNNGLRPLSLYLHIPFCDTVCFYCACNKVITANRQRAQDYLRCLFWEIALQSGLYDRSRVVEQLHFGGGTPTYLNVLELRLLMDELRRHFRLRDDDGGEYAMEIDPRSVTVEDLAALRKLGLNRLSFGVQDVDHQVQQAVNRVQSPTHIVNLMRAARELGFRSTNIDLIYGLPQQSVASFECTLDWVIHKADPDRISVFNYAHLPQRFKVQRQIPEHALPSAAEKLAILATTVATLTGGGYRYIGMDHFAKPDDALSQAQDAGTLTRNFQGYSTHGDCDLIGLGASSIGKVGNAYVQNRKDIADYNACLERWQLPVERGVELDDDDLLRRAVINELICHFRLDTTLISHRFGIDFASYFDLELATLEGMARDGLLSLDNDVIQVSAPGRLLIRNICMVFDRYLGSVAEDRFSRAI